MDRYSFLNAANMQFFADLYEKYVQNPDAVEPSWRAFFQGFDFAQENWSENEPSKKTNSEVKINSTTEIPSNLQKEFQVFQLINAYRTYGHLSAKNNPVIQQNQNNSFLKIENFGLSSADLGTIFNTATEIGLQPTTLQNIITRLKQTFCGAIGVEFMHIENAEIQNWFKNWLHSENNKELSSSEKKSILENLTKAVTFENFLHTKYVGQKRFSLEGGESLVPSLALLVEKGAEKGVSEVVIGMAHRGRLNVLANILDKNPQDIFSEFDGKDYEIDIFDGDVKYHLGHTTEKVIQQKKIKVNLVPNPSHLETVGAVLEGIARAKQDTHYASDFKKVLPIAVHGDAALAGQGIVYEIIQMSGLEGYQTAGTLHIVVNNQVGFTTNYTDARSSNYCTDIAKVTQAPVLHINSDDAEAVAKGILLALDFRMQFGKDVFIDLIGYRKYGHNEGDEPRFTQPILYNALSKHNNPKVIYAERLIKEGVVSEEYISDFEVNYKQKLDNDLTISRQKEVTILQPFLQDEWNGFTMASRQKMLEKVDTSFPEEKLNELAKNICQLPENKSFISKVSKIISDRNQMYFENKIVDWGLAEHLAFATLLSEGYNVRLSGEDVQRGTFSHRHAVVKTQDEEEKIIPLKNINSEGNFYVYNSLLSEYGVLGFEYGYAMASPKTLTIWEAQFGDFANGAQIMIDQYICCGEDKWKNQNGLVLLLPHGYEGQGAEHSSARVERFLQLCATHNMYVANCTTPANIYHLLRRQMKTNFRKPLVVFSPKGLLRHPQVISKVSELSQGEFQEVIDDEVVEKQKVTTIVFCSGRFYYDIVAQREKLERTDVAVIRLEQLFPLPENQIAEIIERYPNATEYVWAQEEPKNMGAYGYLLMNFNKIPLRFAGMDAFSAPASGSHTRDRKRHQQAIDKIFNKEL